MSPFVSGAQRAKCWAQYNQARATGRKPSWDCPEWERTSKRQLPYYSQGKRSTSRGRRSINRRKTSRTIGRRRTNRTTSRRRTNRTTSRRRTSRGSRNRRSTKRTNRNRSARKSSRKR